jgi:DNA polymerase III subunit delta'
VSRGEDASDQDPLHPRDTSELFGHAEAEQALLAAYRSGAMPHAWLIGGPPGIGKATMAYRMARFALAHADPKATAVSQAASLAVPADHPAARRIAAQGHPDLLALERTIGDTGKLRTVITVDEARKTTGFFGSTAAAGGWRICIVDSADELHPSAANALLKMIEEPPSRSLFLLVSHSPGRLLPTIRSRCRRLMLRPLAEDEVLRALGHAAPDAEEQARREAAAASEGSVARAMTFLDERARQMRNQVNALLAKLPALDAAALHSVGDRLAGVDPASLAAFMDSIRGWLTAQVARPDTAPARLARYAYVWEKIDTAAKDVDEYNLERKPLVFAVFAMLSEAARP